MTSRIWLQHSKAFSERTGHKDPKTKKYLRYDETAQQGHKSYDILNFEFSVLLFPKIAQNGGKFNTS